MCCLNALYGPCMNIVLVTSFFLFINNQSIIVETEKRVYKEKPPSQKQEGKKSNRNETITLRSKRPQCKDCELQN